MKIAIGSDHAGFPLKEKIKDLLVQKGIEVIDKGCYNTDSVHYPEFGAAVAKAVAAGEAGRGILVCGTGIGMSMIANRFHGVRATLCHDEFTATACREHNNSNLLCLGARVLDELQALKLVEIWLATEYAGGRHQTRLDLIEELSK